MSYTVFTTPSGHRSLRKLSKSAQRHVIQEARKLADEPFIGQQLHGEFRQLRSLHTRFRSTDYRIAYEVHSDQQEVAVHYVGSRENFYKELKRL